MSLSQETLDDESTNQERLGLLLNLLDIAWEPDTPYSLSNVPGINLDSVNNSSFAEEGILLHKPRGRILGRLEVQLMLRYSYNPPRNSGPHLGTTLTNTL